MGCMKDIAVTFARVEQLAQELLRLSEQRRARTPDCDDAHCDVVLDEVAEIAWKLIDAVRQQ